jgi:predicted metal-dependent enzyme (double-stranded beta helix superfamily)
MAKLTEITPGLQRLKNLIDGDESMSITKVATYVQEADIDVADLLPFADYDHPKNDGYGRKMVVECEHYEIMVMTWNPGDFSAVHDHGYTSWGAVQVFGHVLHHTFAVKHDVFTITKKEILANRTIVKVNNPLIHQMGNVTSSPYLTLHIYGNSEHSGNITDDARIFELENGLIKHTSGGAFFDLPDEKVYDVEEMLEIDQATFVHQASILMTYYQRYAEEKRDDLCRSLLEKLTFIQD